MKIFITGATGFVGRHVIAELDRRGHEIVALVRRPGSLPGVREIVADITRPETLNTEALAGCDAAIHLAAIIREFPSRGISFQKLHIAGTRNILDGCRRAGINRFLHMSALGANHESKAAYLRTKAQMEDMVGASGLDCTIFRPAVILGQGGELTQTLERLTAMRIVPLIGDGSFMMEPLAVATVAQAFGNALDKEATIGKIYELRGEAITYRQLLAKIAEKRDRKVIFVKVPLSMIRIHAALLDRFAWFPVTRQQIVMLEVYQTSADRSAYGGLGVGFKGVEEVLKEAF